MANLTKDQQKKKDQISKFFKSQLSAAKKITGEANSYVATENKMRVIPIPPICLQWLINSNGWPIGRATSSAGNAKTRKSTFAYQLGAWFLDAYGMVRIIDTENKSNNKVIADMASTSKFSNVEMLPEQLQLSSVTTIDEWTKLLLESGEERVANFGTPENMPIPSLEILDSLTGVNSREGQDQLHEDGQVGNATGMRNAKKITEFMRDLPDQLRGWPACIHTVSHQRDRTDGLKGKVRSGGVSPDYYTTIDLVFTEGGTSAYNAGKAKSPGAGKTGSIIEIQVRFSAIGPDGKDQRISVPVIEKYYKDPETGKKSRQVYFDWGAADAHFLFQNKDKIKDTMDIDKINKKGKGDHYWSEALGIKKEAPMPATSFGLLIQSNKDLMSSLRNDLYIEENEVLPPPFGEDDGSDTAE
jgi:hypothetical protein